MRAKSYSVYITGSWTRVLYVGVTNDLVRRMYEHKSGLFPGFTSRYRVNRLLYYETTANVASAIAREKEIKGWVRRRKVELIERHNPEWLDLSPELGL